MTDTQLQELRDIMLDVRKDVASLVKSRDDHETRLRLAEASLLVIEATSKESAAAARRVLGWGMLLAAIAGGFGNFVVRAMASKP